MDQIKIDDFAKIELKVGTVVSAKPHPNADKLMILNVFLGVEPSLKIVAGIAKQYTTEQIIGRQVVVVTNLEPAKLRGEESFGMLLAASDSEGNLALLEPDKIIAAGSLVG